MGLYAIGDLHLSFGNDKPMDVFGDNWKNHAEKIKKGFEGITDDDTVVLMGDLSWGMDFDSAREDLLFIDRLPGKKIILKGNHDYWWNTVTKMEKFFEEQGIRSIKILFNNSFPFGKYAICGTRGWFFEEETGTEHDKKVMLREIGRLRRSLESAGDAEKLVFLHYPPIFQKYECPEILELLSEFRVSLCCYGHIHGKGRRAAFNGMRGFTQFHLLSADNIDFTPIRLIDTPKVEKSIDFTEEIC